MKFIADLHIHSKYSRATSKNLDLENLYVAAQIKGIEVVGTGDAIHPAWFDELKDKLIPAEQGLYRLRDDIAALCDREVPPSCRAPVRFVLQTEISNIYKKKDVTRKNHNLVFFPDLETAEKFKRKIEAIGNIHSDGRPILGLDAKHLLDIALGVSDKSFLIPAHIWTPWFSMLGSRSGFDSLEECFGDLSPHIFAAETGLSSDPAMNRLVSSLDGLSLVSNSDAHSPFNLGREANLFDTDLSYDGIRSALEDKDRKGFLGTIEFYPEEGKYHLDGHRKCGLVCHPKETASYGDLCPACGKPLTLGVLNRVMALSDRKGSAAPSDRFFHRVPLVDLLSEILKTGPQSKRVQSAYYGLVAKFGNEQRILNDIDSMDLQVSGISLLPEAIQRMRSGKILLFPGYDGEYGKIQLFTGEERNMLLGQLSMFDTAPEKERAPQINPECQDGEGSEYGEEEPEKSLPESGKKEIPCSEDSKQQLNEAQGEAVRHPSGPLVIVAGPGTGKTLTLTHRIAEIIGRKRVPPENILAITFTNKAAREMEKRLEKLLGEGSEKPLAATFHQFCLQLLREKEAYRSYGIIEESDRRQLLSHAVKQVSESGIRVNMDRNAILKIISGAKQKIKGPDVFVREDVSEFKAASKIYHIYEKALEVQNLFDFEGIIFTAVSELEADENYRRQCCERFRYIFVDEYQDLNHAQYRLLRALSPTGKDICVIGDPDQSIYGFRGSDYRYFTNFIEDFSGARTVFLDRNYRSTQVILKAAFQVMAGHQLVLPPHENEKREVYSSIHGHNRNVHILETGSEAAEAECVARTIEKMVGGAGYHAVDAGRVGQAGLSRPVAFSDVAVLYRTGDQHRIISECLSRHGIPFQVAGKSGEGLPEINLLFSLFRVVDGTGHYIDFEKVVEGWQPGIGKDTLFSFFKWGFTHGYSLRAAMDEVKRFPIPGMSRLRQEKLVDLVKIINGFARITEGMSFPEKLRYLITHTRLEQLISETPDGAVICDRLLSSIEESGASADAFFIGRALETDIDTVSFDVQKVNLMTLHAAKGLEFPVVFIVGCEKGLIPLERPDEDTCREGEERRLFFVGMTRAREQLFLTWARSRKRFGKKLSREISPFVSDISDDLLILQEPVYGKKRQQVQTQMKLF